MSPTLYQEQPTPDDESEAFRVLSELAHGRFGSLPAPLLARLVLDVTPGADWPVRRAALEALIRRWSFARRDELRVAAHPAGRRVLGVYATRGRSASRPYRTLLSSLEPLREAAIALTSFGARSDSASTCWSWRPASPDARRLPNARAPSRRRQTTAAAWPGMRSGR